MHLLVLQNVLAAVEPDGGSATALRTAAELARLSGAELHVVHAAPETGPAAERALASEVRRVVPWAAAALSVEAGPPEEAIVRQAGRTRAEVIVLGPHRGSPGEDRALGTTADRVVRAAEVPCLVVPSALDLPLRDVLAPVDLSEAARGALAVGLAWASALRKPGAKGEDATCLTVLHVHRPHEGSDAAAGALRREVEEVRRSVSGFAGVRVEEVAEEGDDPADAILRRAEADAAGLVVVGTRGRSGVSDVLGSVSAAVVRRSRTPVLLVPPAAWRRYADDLPA
jgi:universal stress protein E